MKKLLFLVAMIFACGASFAITQCIQFPTGNGSSYKSENYKPDWSATWGNGFVAKGTSLCSNTSGTYAVTGNPTLSSTNVAENKYCWCKMESPAVSAWVFLNMRTSALVCSDDCANTCGYDVRANPTFRSAIFGAVQ